MYDKKGTVEPRYNEVLGTMKITLLYQVKKTKKYKELGLICNIIKTRNLGEYPMKRDNFIGIGESKILKQDIKNMQI